MNKEDIPVITDREELYDKCENMEQLFDKYYLPLLDKHYSKTYKLQQENKKYKEVIDKVKKIIMQPNIEIREYHSCDMDYVYVNEQLLDILKEVE